MATSAGHFLPIPQTTPVCARCSGQFVWRPTFGSAVNHPGCKSLHARTTVAFVYECRVTHAAGVRSGRHLQPTAAFHDRQNRCDLWPRLWAADMQPIPSTKSHRTHGILRQVSTQLQFGIFQEAGELLPQCERVMASLAKCAGGQCNGLRCLDFVADSIDKRSRCFCFEKLSSGMRPTSGMYHSRPTDLVIRCITVGLENAFELSQEPLRPIAPATQAEIKHHASSGATVLPEVRLVVLTSALACLHIDWRFIRLNITSADQFSPHGRDHRDQQLAHFEGPSVQRPTFHGDPLPGFSAKVPLQGSHCRLDPPLFHHFAALVHPTVATETVSQIDSHRHAWLCLH